jgi:hypothetical protein
VGWQAGLGVILLAVGGSSYVVPGFNDLVWPVVIVILGVLLLFRANAARA